MKRLKKKVVVILVKALLDSQKRLNIITMDLVLLVLFATSATTFAGYNDELSGISASIFFPSNFGHSIFFVTIYFLLLQFYEFEPGKIDTLICDLCLILNFLFSMIYFYCLLENSNPLFSDSQMTSVIIFFSILCMSTGGILGVYSFRILLSLLGRELEEIKISLKKRKTGDILNIISRLLK